MTALKPQTLEVHNCPVVYMSTISSSRRCSIWSKFTVANDVFDRNWEIAISSGANELSAFACMFGFSFLPLELLWSHTRVISKMSAICWQSVFESAFFSGCAEFCTPSIALSTPQFLPSSVGVRDLFIDRGCPLVYPASGIEYFLTF